MYVQNGCMALSTNDPFDLYKKGNYLACLDMVGTYLSFHSKDETQEKDTYLRLKRACEYRISTSKISANDLKGARDSLMGILDQFAQSKGKTSTGELDSLRALFEKHKDYESLHFVFSLFAQVYAQSNAELSKKYLLDAKKAAVHSQNIDLVYQSLWQLASHFYKLKSKHLIAVMEEILALRKHDRGACATIHLYLMNLDPKKSREYGERLKSIVLMDVSHYVDCISCLSYAYEKDFSKAKELAQKVVGKHFVIPDISNHFMYPKDAEFPKWVAQMINFIRTSPEAEIAKQFESSKA